MSSRVFRKVAADRELARSAGDHRFPRDDHGHLPSDVQAVTDASRSDHTGPIHLRSLQSRREDVSGERCRASRPAQGLRAISVPRVRGSVGRLSSSSTGAAVKGVLVWPKGAPPPKAGDRGLGCRHARATSQPLHVIAIEGAPLEFTRSDGSKAAATHLLLCRVCMKAHAENPFAAPFGSDCELNTLGRVPTGAS